MEFDVDDADMDAYARQVGRAAEDLEQMKRHCNSHSEVGVSDQGLLNLFLTTHTATVQQVDNALDKLQSVLRAAKGELEAGARYYRATDRDSAAQVDATYPKPER